MTNSERAVQLFQNGMNCSQAILTAFGEPYGVDLQTAEKLGRPLGGGLARTGMTCGALTGAILVLGMAQSETRDEAEARMQVFRSVQELLRRFEERRGSSLCKILLGADMSTEAGAKKIKEENLTAQLCPGFVRDTAEILSQILNSQAERSMMKSA